jgi:2-keto-4-pentenoate hydratase/2-oxohepta-3-ene-1,7-dioic acid hydratase in catechol pathway
VKIIRYRTDAGDCWAELDERRVYPLTAAPYAGGVRTGESLPLDEKALLAPCQPSKIVAVGKNNYDHMGEMGEGCNEIPILFLKAPTCVNDPQGGIPYPKITQRLDY